MAHWAAVPRSIRQTIRKRLGRGRSTLPVRVPHDAVAIAPHRSLRPAYRRRARREPDCHQGRLIASPIAREMAAALGVVTCPDCHRSVAVKGRNGTVLRPRGAGWRELSS